MILHNFSVPDLSKRMRIFDYVCIHLSGVIPSKNAVKKAFKNELILLNGKIALSGEWLLEGDKIEVKPQDMGAFIIFSIKLEVLFEDEFMAVINKPAGFPVSGNYYKTIQNALPYNLTISREEDALMLPRPVHRLDKLTSGLLLIAKTRNVQINLGRQFEAKQISKSYEPHEEKVAFLFSIDFNLESHICGSFNIFLFEYRNRNLKIIRDTRGTRSLFYAKNKEDFFFSSNQKPILEKIKKL